MAGRAQTFEELAAGDGTTVSYTCECCGRSETFESPQAAFDAGWDNLPFFTVVTTCDGCLSSFLVLGRSGECPHHRRAT